MTTPEIYTLSLHAALPISGRCRRTRTTRSFWKSWSRRPRSEEHTSELQSLAYLVCRLLLEKRNAKHCIDHSMPQNDLKLTQARNKRETNYQNNLTSLL